MNYASVYRLAVKEARRIEDAQIKHANAQDDARIARTLAANGGKPFKCPHPTDFRQCITECRGCCTESYIAKR